MVLSPVVPISVIAGLAGAAAILLSSDGPHGAACLSRFLRWQDRQRQRAALLALDDRLLRDVGLSREQAEHEARRHD